MERNSRTTRSSSKSTFFLDFDYISFRFFYFHFFTNVHFCPGIAYVAYIIYIVGT
jgi:hypothetical protein